MSPFVLKMAIPAVVSGSSTFFYVVVAIALIAGVGVIIFGPGPARGLGIGLIVGAALISLIILTGPSKP
ncbi:MAG: hypothetical protein ACR2KV_00400 [Solirubrobacteraceae bacterium]